jgi:[ribosomal protein S5]-alanine N-acetyltransferase
LSLDHPEIVTPRLTLEPLTVAHASLLHAGFSDAAMHTLIPTDPQPLDAMIARHERILKGPLDRNDELWRNWAIRLHDAVEPTYVGMVETSVFPNDYAYLAYFIFTPHQRKGFAHEACSAALAHLRATYAIKRVVVEMDTKNTASWKLTESLGGKRVATKPNADFFKGRSSDEYHYEITF